MLLVPNFREWQYRAFSEDGIRPASAYGKSLTPGENTYGSYVGLITTPLTYDCFGIEIIISSGVTVSESRNHLITIGKDDAGGTTYVDWLTHLLAVGPASYQDGGIKYFFPMFIPAGATIAAKASVNNATVRTVRVLCKCYGLPRNPETIRYATIFRTFGETTASSSGTAITPGTTSEGAWAQLGSATAENLWWWQIGLGLDNAAVTTQLLHLDLGAGDATNKRVIMQDVAIYISAAESSTTRASTEEASQVIPVGDLIYGRAQGSTTIDTGYSMIAYGVG